MTAFEESWKFLKALPEQQFYHRKYMRPGTLHPAVLAMARRKQAKSPFGSVEIRRLQRPDDGIQETEKPLRDPIYFDTPLELEGGY